MEEQLKITIGIPAYNVEKYAFQSISSAMDQTYHYLEILVVDDGSTDGTGFIADKLAEKDPRVKVLHQENHGLSAVRERIIQEMTGDAIYWLDSDDWLEPDAIANNAAIMEARDADIVKTVIKAKEEKYCGAYTRDQYLRILLPDHINSNVIGCLIKKSAYYNVHHNVNLVQEDYDTFPKLVNNSKRIIVDNSGTYHYRVMRKGSITASGAIAYKGYYPRAILTSERYDMWKDEFPEECKTILKQFTDYACMACLYAKEEDRSVLKIRNLIAHKEQEIAISQNISSYKKWLVREVLSHGKYFHAAAIMHKTKGKLRMIKEKYLS